MEQQLRTQIDESRFCERTRVDRFQVEIEQLTNRLLEQQRTTEADAREATGRIGKAEARVKDRAEALTAEIEQRAKGLNESLEAMKRHNAEQFEQVRARGLELQKSLEATLREQGTWLGQQAREAAQEMLQRANREASDGCAVLRQRLEDQLERLSTSTKEAEGVLNRQLSDAQGEWRAQLETERPTARSFVEEGHRQMAEKVREAQAAVEGRRQESDTQFREQLEDVRRTLRREIAEGNERVESIGSGALTREVESLRKGIEDAQHSATASAAHHAEAAERQLRKYAEAANDAIRQARTHQTDTAEEIRALLTDKVESVEAQLDECREKIQLIDKDLKLTAEELPSFWRRWESARQSDVSAIEELRWAMQDSDAKLARQIQGEAEAVALLAKQLMASEEGWRVRAKEDEERSQAQCGAAQKELATIRVDLIQLQAAHSEAGQVWKGRSDRQGRDLLELNRRHKEFAADLARRVKELEKETTSARILALFGEHVEGMARSCISRELQTFQREALDSVEWKLDRCVQWLHGANVKLGLNPHGTLFSLDRFREELFEGARASSSSARGRRPRTADVRR